MLWGKNQFQSAVASINNTSVPTLFCSFIKFDLNLNKNYNQLQLQLFFLKSTVLKVNISFHHISSVLETTLLKSVVSVTLVSDTNQDIHKWG